MVKKDNQISATTNSQNVSISEIDLSQASIRELMTLKARVDEELEKANTTRFGPYDVAVEYVLRARANGEIVHDSEGTIRLNSVLHPRLLPTAPMKLESMVIQQLLEPLSADLSVVFDGVAPEKPSLATIKQAAPSPKLTYAAQPQTFVDEV